MPDTSMASRMSNPTTRRCCPQASSQVLQQITQALNGLTGQITRLLATRLTASESRVDGLGSSLAAPIQGRMDELESRTAGIIGEPLRQLESRMGSLGGRTEDIASRLPRPDTTSDEAERPGLGPDLEEESSPSTSPSSSPSPYSGPSATPYQSPQIESSPYSSECPKIDLCEPLRIWIANLLTQTQRANVSASANPMMRYYERAAEEQEQQQQQQQNPQSINATMSLHVAQLETEPPDTESEDA